MELGTIISVISIVIAVLSFFFARKDKSNKDTSHNSYNQGKLDAQLQNIFAQLEKIEKKLDSYDSEIDTRIEKAILNHEKAYHNQ